VYLLTQEFSGIIPQGYCFYSKKPDRIGFDPNTLPYSVDKKDNR